MRIKSPPSSRQHRQQGRISSRDTHSAPTPHMLPRRPGTGALYAHPTQARPSASSGPGRAAASSTPPSLWVSPLPGLASSPLRSPPSGSPVRGTSPLSSRRLLRQPNTQPMSEVGQRRASRADAPHGTAACGDPTCVQVPTGAGALGFVWLGSAPATSVLSFAEVSKKSTT